MPEQERPRDPAPHYGETERPMNPPNSVLQPAVRRSAVRTYVGGIVGVFIIVGAVLVYWATRDSAPDPELNRAEPSSVGTGGDTPTGGNPTESSPGGFDPVPRPESTRDELEFRGAGGRPQGAMPPLAGGAALNALGSLLEEPPSSVVGRRIEVTDVEVERVERDGTFWIEDGDARARVVAPGGSGRIRQGDRVDVRGTVEGDGGGSVRIRASEVQVR